MDLSSIKSKMDIASVLEKIDWATIFNKVDWSSIANKIDMALISNKMNHVTSTIVNKIDMTSIYNKIDLTAFYNKIDMTAIYNKIDMTSLLSKIDMSSIVNKLDMTNFLNKINLSSLLDKVDWSSVHDKMDLNALLNKLDWASILDKMSSETISEQVEIIMFVTSAVVVSLVQYKCSKEQVLHKNKSSLNSRFVHTKRSIAMEEMVMTSFSTAVSQAPSQTVYKLVTSFSTAVSQAPSPAVYKLAKRSTPKVESPFKSSSTTTLSLYKNKQQKLVELPPKLVIMASNLLSNPTMKVDMTAMREVMQWYSGTSIPTSVRCKQPDIIDVLCRQQVMDTKHVKPVFLEDCNIAHYFLQKLISNDEAKQFFDLYNKKAKMIKSKSLINTKEANSKSSKADTKADTLNCSDPSSSTGRKRTNMIFLLLLETNTKTFELIQLRYPIRSTTVGDIIRMIPRNARELALGTQLYIALSHPKNRAAPVKDLNMLASDPFASESGSPGTAGIREGDVIVAIPADSEHKSLMRLAKQVLSNPQVQELVGKQELFDKKVKVSKSSMEGGSENKSKDKKVQKMAKTSARQKHNIKKDNVLQPARTNVASSHSVNNKYEKGETRQPLQKASKKGSKYSENDENSPVATENTRPLSSVDNIKTNQPLQTRKSLVYI